MYFHQWIKSEMEMAWPFRNIYLELRMLLPQQKCEIGQHTSWNCYMEHQIIIKQKYLEVGHSQIEVARKRSMHAVLIIYNLHYHNKLNFTDWWIELPNRAKQIKSPFVHTHLYKSPWNWRNLSRLRNKNFIIDCYTQLITFRSLLSFIIHFQVVYGIMFPCYIISLPCL